MNQVRYLADHDLIDAIVEGVLRLEPSIEFWTARELNLHRKGDDSVLAYAAHERLIVVSHDVNTMTFAAGQRLARNEPMRGLFLVHQNRPIRQTIANLVLIWSASEAHEWEGQIRFLPIER